MKIVKAFFKLIRWPNLFFIALTQFLFYYFIFFPLTNQGFKLSNNSDFLFYLLVTASVLIAAGGYIINDYFDLHIDNINKPEKVVVDKIVKRRWTIVWHLIFSFAGIIISGYLSFVTHKWIILLANILSVLLLWIYSTHFKRKLLIGNITIALLTAWVIIVIYFFVGGTFINSTSWINEHYHYDIRKLFKFTILYAGFAFVMSLIREAVKDLEDINGDAQFHCKTMPIKWGVPVTKMFIAVWMVVCIVCLLILQIYAWQIGWKNSAVYSTLIIIFPLLFSLKKLYKASNSKDFHQLSTYLKLIMLAGILSMVFFK
jgi:4-hydroxybenzoate polyprenyltransferase